MADPFASHIVSLILAWICGVVFFSGFIVWVFGSILDSDEGSLGRYASFWITLCLLVFMLR